MKAGGSRRRETGAGSAVQSLCARLAGIRFSFSGSAQGGTISINGVTISAHDPGVGDYFIIDCEKQDIYKYGSLDNWNNQFTLVDGEFFELKPGRNQVIMSGIQHGEVYITPNWWTV